MPNPPESTRHNLTPVKRGDSITAKHYNSLVEFGRDINRTSKSEAYETGKGWMPMVRNITGENLPMFSIVRLKQPYFRDGERYPLIGYYNRNYIEAEKPTGDESDVVAVNITATRNGATNRFVVCGTVFCKVKYTASTLNCNYATTEQNNFSSLVAAESGQCKIIWSEQRAIGEQWSYVLINTGGAGAVSEETKILALCEEKDGSVYKFSKCNINGTRLSYDVNEQITAELAPYIPDVSPGGFYVLEWFPDYNSWVVVAGTCSNDPRSYTPYTTHTITMHSTGENSTATTSGDFSIGEHDGFATLEYSLITIHDISGHPNQSLNLFVTEPTFALNSTRDRITYTGVQLTPGAYGIAVYQFVVTNCNGSCRDVYTVAFRCIEENAAPYVSISQNSITIHCEEQTTQTVCYVYENDEGDELSIVQDSFVGDANLISSYTLTIDPLTNEVILNVQAGSYAVGTGSIQFYVDDGHDLQCTEGSYDLVSIDISVTNSRPVVAITNSPIQITHGDTDTFEIGTITDPDGDDVFNFTSFRYEGDGIIDSVTLSVQNGKLYATIATSPYYAGSETVYFIANDKYGFYSDGAPEEIQFEVVVENAAPIVDLTVPEIHANISDGTSQEFIIGSVTNKDSNDGYQLRISVESITGEPCIYGMDIINNDIHVYLDLPQSVTTGTTTVRFTVEDQFGNYSTPNNTITYQVLISNDEQQNL